MVTVDKGTNNQDPSTFHKTDKTLTTEIALIKLDGKTKQAIKIDSDCKVDSSQRGGWIYNYRKLRNQRLIIHKGPAKGIKIKEVLAL